MTALELNCHIKNMSQKYYVVFVRDELPRPAAHLVWAAHCANGASNLGYPSLLVYLKRGNRALNPLDWIVPFQPQKPDRELQEFYNLQDRLRVLPLAMPWPIDRLKTRWTNSSTAVCKYYLPFHIAPHTGIVHTRDWNFVKAAIANGLPVVYEHHHYNPKPFEPEIVNSKLFQIAVTLSQPVLEDMLGKGMPAEKILKLHSGLNPLFLKRQPEAAEAWRVELLNEKASHLVVYSGGLYPFKGVNLLLEVAQKLPQVQFAFAGGSPEQVNAYRKVASGKCLDNVIFLGHLPQMQLAALLQAADILTHPHSIGKAASVTSPLKFFDYLASGSPIVATEIPPLMEFKSANVVAGWCPPNQAQPLTDCIEKVLAECPRNPDGNAKNIEFARQFSWEKRIQTILDRVDPAFKVNLEPVA